MMLAPKNWHLIEGNQDHQLLVAAKKHSPQGGHEEHRVKKEWLAMAWSGPSLNSIFESGSPHGYFGT
eukprot:5691984-Amphidinium_carterae.1